MKGSVGGVCVGGPVRGGGVSFVWVWVWGGGWGGNWWWVCCGVGGVCVFEAAGLENDTSLTGRLMA